MMRIALPVCCLLAATWSHAAAPTPDKLLPPDTILVITAPDYSALRKATEKSPTLQLWNDQVIRPFKDKFLAKWKSEVVEPLEREFGVKFADYQGMAQGQVTWALTQQSGQDKPGLLFLMDTGTKTETLKTNLANLKKSWIDKGKQLKNEKIRDLEFTTFIFSSDDLSKTFDKLFPDPEEGFEKLEEPKPKKPATKVEWTVGQSGSLFILGDSPQQIEKVLVRQSGSGAPSLSEQGAFAANYGKLFRNAVMYGWIDTKTLLAQLTKKDKEKSGPEKKAGMDAEAMLKAVGLNAVQGVAFNVEHGVDGDMVNVNVNIPESVRQGLFKILSFSAKDSGPPPFVPADAVKFSRWRFDFAQAWNTLERMISEMSPAAAGTFKLIIDSAGKDKDPDFSLRKSVLENLGDDVISYQKAAKNPSLQQLNSQPSLTLIASPRPEQFAAGLKALASTILPQQSRLKEREFLGRKVYSLNLPQGGPPGGGAPKSDRTLSFAASGGYVAIATDPAVLEEYLRGTPEKSLRDFPGLAAAADKVGGMGTGLFSFENQKETTRVTLETLRKESGSLANLFGSSAIAGRLGMKDDKNKFKEWFDFSLLPPFDQISKYFYLSVWSGAVTADGMQFKAFIPQPPALR